MDERTTQLMHTAMGAGFSEAFMDDVGEESLEHYGRLGMKWYKHIFGDRDDRAAYSNGGKGENQTDDSRPKSSSSSRGKRTLSPEQKKKMQEARAKSREAKAKAEEDAAVLEAQKKEWAKDPRQVLAHKELFSTQELRDAIDRYRVEDDLSNLSARRYPQGKSRVNQVMEIVNTGANAFDTGARFTKNAVTFYNNAAVIYNSLSGPDKKKMPTIGTKEKKERTPEEIRKQAAEAYAAELKAQKAEDELRWGREDRRTKEKSK